MLFRSRRPRYTNSHNSTHHQHQPNQASCLVAPVAAAVVAALQLGLHPHPLINLRKLVPQQLLLLNNLPFLLCNSQPHPVPDYLVKWHPPLPVLPSVTPWDKVFRACCLVVAARRKKPRLLPPSRRHSMSPKWEASVKRLPRISPDVSKAPRTT